MSQLCSIYSKCTFKKNEINAMDPLDKVFMDLVSQYLYKEISTVFTTTVMYRLTYVHTMKLEMN